MRPYLLKGRFGAHFVTLSSSEGAFGENMVRRRAMTLKGWLYGLRCQNRPSLELARFSIVGVQLKVRRDAIEEFEGKQFWPEEENLVDIQTGNFQVRLRGNQSAE